MSSIKYISSSTAVPIDLVKKIGITGVNEIITILWQGYYSMLKDPFITINESTEEDEITQKWAEKVNVIWDSRNRATAMKINGLSPIHQYADNTMKKKKGKKSPIIDFCFKDWNTDNCYFGVEAKNLYQNRTDKIKRYVTTGINNFTNGRYGSQSSQSSIIGYILSGDIPTIISELRVEIGKGTPIANLSRISNVEEPQYQSKHIRSSDSEEIILHHLFFNFVSA